MSVAAEQLDPAVRQRVRKSLLLRRGDRAFVAAEQQDRGAYTRQQRQGIDALEAIMHRGGDIRLRPVHLAHDPVAQIFTGAFLVEPIAKRLPAPFADT
jgi:hypothetical protein